MRYFLLAFFLTVILVVGIAGRRGSLTRRTPFEIFPDMDRQPKLRPQTKNAFFKDGMSSQLPVPGTIARGAAFEETVLTTGNVNQQQFGKLFSYPVDGQIYAQPLYVPSINIAAKGMHNVAYVATEHDTVYAFDADGSTTTPLWQASFIDPKCGSSIAHEVSVTASKILSSPACATLWIVGAIILAPIA